MKDLRKIYFIFTIYIIAIFINISCNKEGRKLEENIKSKRISKNYEIYESPYGNIYICGEDSITNKVDKRIVNVIKNKLITERRLIDLVVLIKKDKPNCREYWFISIDRNGKVYRDMISRKEWFNKEGIVLSTEKIIDKWYRKERLEKIKNRDIETNIDIIKYYRINRDRPIGSIASNLYLLSKYRIEDLPKVEVPMYIIKVSSKPNTNILVATIGYDKGGEFVPDIKANLYVYEIMNGKAKKVYEDLRCGSGLLKNGLVIKRYKDKLIIYLFIKRGNAESVRFYIMKNSNKIKNIKWNDIKDIGKEYNYEIIKKKYHIIDIGS